MGWSIGYDSKWGRDIGYGVPAYCDHPKCGKEIDRGLAFVCGSDPHGGDYGCGLYFCEDHFGVRQPRGAHDPVQLCPRCMAYRPPYAPSREHPEWLEHKMTDDSWAPWRAEHPVETAAMKIALEALHASA